MESNLSFGCLKFILLGEVYDKKPILQILGTKPIDEGSERYRLIVSDGKYLNSFAMLAIQLNHLYYSGQLADNTIINVEKYTASLVGEKNSRRVLIIQDLSIIKSGEEVGKRIGNPEVLNTSSINNSSNQVKENETPQPSTSNQLKENETAQPSTSIQVKENVTPQPSTSNQVRENKTPQSSISGGSQKHEIQMETDNTDFNLTEWLQSYCVNKRLPISSLGPYQFNSITARVFGKSSIRTYTNAKGKGKFFSIYLKDESGEIRATAFNNESEKYFDMIELDKVYFISTYKLKPSNKQYCELNHDYEMTFTPETIVKPIAEEETIIPKMQFNWVPINQISNMKPKSVVDVIGICRNFSALQTILAKSKNREFQKRELTLIDNSNASIQLTLWEEEAIKFDGNGQPVIAVKSAVVTEYEGAISLNFGTGSNLINRDFPESYTLRDWCNNGGGSNISSNISSRTGFNTEYLTFNEINIKNLGNAEKPEYFQVKAVVHPISTKNVIYKACPQTHCSSKLKLKNGNFICDKCNNQTPNFKYRIILNMNIKDWTSSRWVSCFNEVAEKMIGRAAEDIGEEVENNPKFLQNLLSTVLFKSFSFKLRSKLETFEGIQRTKTTVVNAVPVLYKEYNKYLIKNLKTLLGVGQN